MSLKELQAVWTEFGKRDPLWAVLTDPCRKGGKWDVEDFFRSGREEIKDVLVHINPNLFYLPQKRALDFGCGAGRLTQALAEIFEEVVGLDISPTMIDQAQKLNLHGSACRFMLNDRDDLRLFPDGHFDFVYSSITLQHIDPVYSRKYIRELLRVLAPGGNLVFQIPERPVRPLDRFFYRVDRRRWYARERRKAGDIIMEMHGLARPEVARLVAEGGGAIYYQQANYASGDKWLAWKYYVHKPRFDLRVVRVMGPRVVSGASKSSFRLRVENRTPGTAGGAVDDPLIKAGARVFSRKLKVTLFSLKEYRAELPRPFPAGSAAEVEVVLDLAGFPPGGYWLYADIVHEGKVWFSEFGLPPIVKAIKVTR
jgi:SAM-dependent methyltransferase